LYAPSGFIFLRHPCQQLVGGPSNDASRRLTGVGSGRRQAEPCPTHTEPQLSLVALLPAAGQLCQLHLHQLGRHPRQLCGGPGVQVSHLSGADELPDYAVYAELYCHTQECLCITLFVACQLIIPACSAQSCSSKVHGRHGNAEPPPPPLPPWRPGTWWRSWPRSTRRPT
jgi:hypothetical protein